MSRSSGALQREIKGLLDRGFKLLGPLRFVQIRAVFVIEEGGNPETDRLDPTHERSLKRALKTLVERGDVLILGGKGRSGDPYSYVTVESFAAMTGETVKDTAHAKQIVAELQDAANAFFASGFAKRQVSTSTPAPPEGARHGETQQ
jgi:hypothetical protein